MTEAQAAALWEAKENVRAAKINLDHGLPKIAAARAYFAMFYAAQAFLYGKGLEFSKHSAVIAAFGQHFAKTGLVPEVFHRYLIEAQEFRNLADYKLGAILTPDTAALQINRAASFLAIAEETLGRIGDAPPGE